MNNREEKILKRDQLIGMLIRMPSYFGDIQSVATMKATAIMQGIQSTENSSLTAEQAQALYDKSAEQCSEDITTMVELLTTFVVSTLVALSDLSEPAIVRQEAADALHVYSDAYKNFWSEQYRMYDLMCSSEEKKELVEKGLCYSECGEEAVTATLALNAKFATDKFSSSLIDVIEAMGLQVVEADK